MLPAEGCSRLAPSLCPMLTPRAARPLACPQALCFLEQGRTFVPAKPWVRGEEGKWVAEELLLSPAVRAHLARLRAQRQEQGEQMGASGLAP